MSKENRTEGNWATATPTAVVQVELSLSEDSKRGLASELPHDLLAIPSEISCRCDTETSVAYSTDAWQAKVENVLS